MCYAIIKSLLKETTMATVVVCPNCRSQLSPCLTVTCPLLSPSTVPNDNCQRCRGGAPGAATPCLAGEMIPHFPLPYVCRHWLQVSRSVPCSHGHSCSSTMPTPACQVTQAEENLKPSEKSHSLQVQGLSLNGLVSGATVKDLSSSSSRSVSPESHLVLPDFFISINRVAIPALQTVWTPQDDKRVLAASTEALQASGWYYGAMTWQEAASLLANKPEGTFLLRDSSSNNCPFALSVQTPQGPTSIRIEYEQGKFWLDCEKKGVTPQLSGIIELVQYYRLLGIGSDISDQSVNSQKPSHTRSSKEEKHVWIDHRGRVFSPIRIVAPLKKSPSSLKHLCRLAIHSHHFPESHLRSLPSTLIAFVRQYQYSL